MRGEIRDKLWRQLESEILLHRHKTVIRACRSKGNGENAAPASEPPGGREHGVPILISELEPDGPAARCGVLYVGDAILNVNGHDLKEACHQEAVEILSAQLGDISLEVQYVAAEDSDEENSLGEDMYGFRNASDCSVPGSPNSMLATSKPTPVATTVSCSTNSLSYQSDANNPSPYSPMQVSTDGSNIGRSSNSEESPGKSPVKEQDDFYEGDHTSTSIPSTPNNNCNDTTDHTCNGNYERNFNAHNIGISTLQQIFGKSNSNSSMSLENSRQSSEVMDNVDCKLENSEITGTDDEKLSENSPKKVLENEVIVSADETPNRNIAKSPMKSCKRDKDNVDEVSGDVSSQPSPASHKVGRKGTSKSSNYVLKLSDKGRRSGKAHRMVPEGSSTSSSFDEEQMASTRKMSSSKRSSRNISEVSVLAVGNSPTHINSVDTFGDPDFGTPV
ncbi:hypothetical protein C0J52_14346 [Blattella germanica]|nr:hypothetical protein C0J52_14346 [Blattella germanica]